MFDVWLVFIAVGSFAGFIAGLFGVGGGMILVPLFVATFTWQAMDSQWLTHVAIGTSLSIISVNAVSSSWKHWQQGCIEWRLAKPLCIGVSLGTVLGVWLFVHLQAKTLQWLIACYLLWVMTYMLRPVSHAVVRSISSTTLTASGIFIGGTSAIFGIGGGSLTVPLLSYLGARMQTAVAVSAVCGVPIALVGSAMNGLLGWGKVNEPYMLGFIYLPAFAAVAIFGAVFARIGARVAYNTSDDRLKKMFALLMGIIAIAMMFKALH